MEDLDKENSLLWQKGTRGNWTRNLNLFLIEKRIALDNTYFKNPATRNKGWREILNEFHKLGFKQFGIYNMKKRWVSMFQTYKDYKKILTTNEVCWPYYQIIDDYFIKNEENLSDQNQNDKTNLNYICLLCKNEYNRTFVEKIDTKLDLIVRYLHLKFQTDADETGYICNLCSVKLSQFHMFYLNCHRSNQSFLKTEIQIDEQDLELETKTSEPNRKHENLTLEEIFNIEKNDSETEDLEYLEDILEVSFDDKTNAVEVPEIELNKSDLNQDQNKRKKTKKTVTNKPKSEKGSKKCVIKNDYTTKEKTCGLCPAEFISNKALTNHMKYVHKEKLTCPIENCDKKVYSHNILKIHIARDHLGKSSWICKHCGKGFNYKHLLDVHEKNHFNIKDVPCDICEEKFVSYSHLKRHKDKIHHKAFFYCSQCLKKFLSKSMLIRHEVVHTGKRDFQCEKCEKSFVTKRELKVHKIRVHEGGTHSHSCSFCFKSFNSTTGKKLHERVHTGERPYECTICEKTYTCMTHLNRHVKLIHKNKDQQ